MRVVSLAVALLWAAAASAATPADEARTWIKRMNEALVSRNYDGVLTHRWTGGAEVVRLIHRMQGGHMVERAMATDGSGHEEIRNGEQWVRYLPEKRVALVQTRTRSFGYISTHNGLSAESDKYYIVSNGGPQRLLGWPGPTQFIAVEPRDSLRHGYRFWLDPKTAMPVRTQLVTQAGEVIDEMSFISLKLLDSVADELLRPAADVRGYHMMRLDARPETVKVAFVPQAALLPAGFRVLNLEPAATDAKASGPQSRFVVSDGIAWVSVFVSPAGKPLAEGRGQPVGASESYVKQLDRHYITVVGEVPSATARAIAEAVRPE